MKREVVQLPGPKSRCSTRRTTEAAPLAPAKNTQHYCFNVFETEKARTYQLAGGVATESSHQAKARRLGLPTTNPSYPDTSSSRSSQRAATATSLQNWFTRHPRKDRNALPDAFSLTHLQSDAAFRELAVSTRRNRAGTT